MNASCPKCGRHGLVATFVGVVQTNEVKGVDGDGLLIYGETKSTGGTLECVRCPACGGIILDEGKPIRSLSTLAVWLAGRMASGQH